MTKFSLWAELGENVSWQLQPFLGQDEYDLAWVDSGSRDLVAREVSIVDRSTKCSFEEPRAQSKIVLHAFDAGPRTGLDKTTSSNSRLKSRASKYPCHYLLRRVPTPLAR